MEIKRFFSIELSEIERNTVYKLFTNTDDCAKGAKEVEQYIEELLSAAFCQGYEDGQNASKDM